MEVVYEEEDGSGRGRWWRKDGGVRRYKEAGEEDGGKEASYQEDGGGIRDGGGV